MQYNKHTYYNYIYYTITALVNFIGYLFDNIISLFQNFLLIYIHKVSYSHTARAVCQGDYMNDIYFIIQMAKVASIGALIIS